MRIEQAAPRRRMARRRGTVRAGALALTGSGWPASLRILALAGVVVALAASSTFAWAGSLPAVEGVRLPTARLAVQAGFKTMLRCLRAIDGCLHATQPPHGLGDAVAATSPETVATVPDAIRASEAGLSPRDDAWHAWQELEQARATLRQAQHAQARASSSPEARELMRAQQDVTEAQAAATRARLDLERLNGPNPARLAAANRMVERAEATFRALRAEGAPRGPDGVDPPRPSSFTSAERALQDAITQRDQILVGPPLQDVEAARRVDADARQAFEAAAHRLELARQGVGLLSIAEADAAVVAAQIAVYDAESRVHALQSGRP